jgi:hypothetical protein
MAVQISLYNGDIEWYTIEDMTADDGLHEWTIPDDIYDWQSSSWPIKGFQVKITNHNYGWIYDFSDGSFSIDCWLHGVKFDSTNLYINIYRPSDSKWMDAT